MTRSDQQVNRLESSLVKGFSEGSGEGCCPPEKQQATRECPSPSVPNKTVLTFKIQLECHHLVTLSLTLSDLLLQASFLLWGIYGLWL